MPTGFCSKCGQALFNSGKTLNGKKYCNRCYDELIKELQKADNDKKELFSYIQNLFKVSSCPPSVISGIEKLVRDGKKLRGIRLTIHWYYVLCGHEPNNIDFLIKTIEEQYNNARDYMVQQKTVNEQNKAIDLNNIPAENITIKSQKEKRGWKPKYKMEDL